jgi:hypothetical protein
LRPCCRTLCVWSRPPLLARWVDLLAQRGLLPRHMLGNRHGRERMHGTVPGRQKQLRSGCRLLQWPLQRCPGRMRWDASGVQVDCKAMPDGNRVLLGTVPRRVLWQQLPGSVSIPRSPNAAGTWLPPARSEKRCGTLPLTARTFRRRPGSARGGTSARPCTCTAWP